MAWLSGWQYRKKVTISGSTGAGTDYQVLLKVGESSGASGYDFHIEGHSANFPSGKDDGGDLRFTDNDETTLLDFWVEKVEGSSPNRVAYIWVKVKDDLGSNVDIYCYYGNSSASNYSNGDNTFLFFDDFPGTSLDTNKWDTSNIGGGSYSVSDSLLHLSYSGSGENPVLNTVNTFTTGNRTFEVKWKINSIEGQAVGFNLKSALSGNAYLSYFLASSTSTHEDTYIDTNADGTYEDSSDWLSWATGTEYRMRHYFKSGETKWDRDGTIHTYAGSFDQAVYIILGYFKTGDTRTDKTFDADFDFVFVRKYVDPEPSFSSVGSEESEGMVATSNQTLNLLGVGN